MWILTFGNFQPMPQPQTLQIVSNIECHFWRGLLAGSLRGTNTMECHFWKGLLYEEKEKCYRLALKMFQIWRLENFSSAVVCFWLCCSIRKFTRWLLKILYTVLHTLKERVHFRFKIWCSKSDFSIWFSRSGMISFFG